MPTVFLIGAVIAFIADAIVVLIGLPDIGLVDAVVFAIRDAVAIGVDEVAQVRTGVAGITDAVAVGIFLPAVFLIRAVIANVANAIVVVIRLTGIEGIRAVVLFIDYPVSIDIIVGEASRSGTCLSIRTSQGPYIVLTRFHRNAEYAYLTTGKEFGWLAKICTWRKFIISSYLNSYISRIAIKIAEAGYVFLFIGIKIYPFQNRR